MHGHDVCVFCVSLCVLCLIEANSIDICTCHMSFNPCFYIKCIRCTVQLGASYWKDLLMWKDVLSIILFIYGVGFGKWSCTGFIFKRAGMVLFCLHESPLLYQGLDWLLRDVSKVCGHGFLFLSLFFYVDGLNHFIRWQLPNYHKCLHFHYKKRSTIVFDNVHMRMHFV